MTARCPVCHAKDLRPTLARMMARCPACAWEGFPVAREPQLRRIPPRPARS